MPSTDAWSRVQYERFAAERKQPFVDLLRLLQPAPDGRAVDLGCGSGELTVELHEHLGVATTLGIDSSPAMLAGAPEVVGVSFAIDDLTTFQPERPLDVIAANASLQWVPDHPAVLRRLAALLAPGGQLGVQVPTNADHASHTAAAAVAHEEPFRSALDGSPPVDPVAANVLPPARYAELLYELGFAEQHVRLQVYGHVLDATSDVVEWTKGTSFTRFKRLLSDDLYAAFVERYRDRVMAELGDRRPYFYAFKRILLWGRLAS